MNVIQEPSEPMGGDLEYSESQLYMMNKNLSII